MSMRGIFLLQMIALVIIASLDTMHGQVTWRYDVQYHAEPEVVANLLSLDIGIPVADELAPVLIYVHGGGWTSGDKANLSFKGHHFTNKGWIFVSVNYRLSPFPFELENDDRIMYPTHTDDVARAVAFVLERVEDYGGDVDRVTLMGHSTGAHIVSQIVADQQYLQRLGHDPSELRCACSNDIGGYDLSSWLGSDIANVDLYTNAFGSDTATWLAASPLLQLDGDDHDMPDLLIIKRGRQQRKQQADDFYQACVRYSDARVDLYDADPLTHAEVNQLIGDTSSADGLRITAMLDNWLEPCAGQLVATSMDQMDRAPFRLLSMAVDVFSDGILSVFDLAGREVYKQVCTEGERVVFDNLCTGMYVLRMDTNNGSWTTRYYHLVR